MENRIRMTVSQPATAAADWGQEDSRKVAQSAINLYWHVYFLFRPYLHYLFTPSVLQFEHNFNGQHLCFSATDSNWARRCKFHSGLFTWDGRVQLVCQMQQWDDTAQRSVHKKPQRILISHSFILISHLFTIVLCYSNATFLIFLGGSESGSVSKPLILIRMCRKLLKKGLEKNSKNKQTANASGFHRRFLQVSTSVQMASSRPPSLLP